MPSEGAENRISFDEKSSFVGLCKEQSVELGEIMCFVDIERLSESGGTERQAHIAPPWSTRAAELCASILQVASKIIEVGLMGGLWRCALN
jgi:hypothetical protein